MVWSSKSLKGAEAPSHVSDGTIGAVVDVGTLHVIMNRGVERAKRRTLYRFGKLGDRDKAMIGC